MTRPLPFFSCLLVVTGGIAPGAATAEGPSPPTPFEAEYALYAKGMKVAKVRRQLTRLDNGGYEYRSETRAAGVGALLSKLRIIETTVLEAREASLRPEFYRYARSGDKKKREVSIEFDWVSGQIKNIINGDSWQMPTQPAVMDKLLYQLALMHDLNNGRLPASYLIADGGRIKTYHFEKLGEETLAIPLGSFKTIKMLRQRPGSNRKSTFWCAFDLEFMPVQVEHVEKDGTTTRAVLQSLQGIEP